MRVDIFTLYHHSYVTWEYEGKETITLGRVLSRLQILRDNYQSTYENVASTIQVANRI